MKRDRCEFRANGIACGMGEWRDEAGRNCHTGAVRTWQGLPAPTGRSQEEAGRKMTESC